MIVLGIDPGVATVGYGVLEKQRDGRVKTLDYGIITTAKELSLPSRLKLIYDGVSALIKKFKADAVAVEELFFAKNITTAIAVSHARGVILHAATEHCGNLYEFTPLQIKQALTGYGRADKHQIQAMVKMLLSLDKIPKPDDAADALAVAITFLQTNNMSSLYRI